MSTGVGNSDAWCSAEEVTVPLEQFFGGPVHTDPCSNEFSIVRARVKYTYGGLHRPWGETTYENPPYSKTKVWTDCAINEMRIGNVRELVRLTMVSTSTVWWRRQCLVPRRNPRLLFTRRLKFYDPFAKTTKVTKMGARFDTVLTYYGPRVTAFEAAFRHLTRWMSWGR
jgi:DNA N-6-adenine-methyltransferase (Dam)